MLPFPSKALRKCCRNATDSCRRKGRSWGWPRVGTARARPVLNSAGAARQFLGCRWRRAGSARVGWTAPCAITCCPHPDPLPSLVSPSFGLAPAAPLQVHAPLAPNQSVEISLPLNTVGSVMKMDPLNNLQVGNMRVSPSGELGMGQGPLGKSRGSCDSRRHVLAAVTPGSRGMGWDGTSWEPAVAWRC